MSSESDNRSLIETMKQRNHRDLTVAQEAQRQVALAEKNWLALIEVVRRTSELQLKILDQQMTQEQASNYLAWQESMTREHLWELRNIEQEMARQVGRLNGECSSIVKNMEKELFRIQENMTTETRMDLECIAERAHKSIMAITIAGGLFLTFLTVCALFFLT